MMRDCRLWGEDAGMLIALLAVLGVDLTVIVLCNDPH
jgi:hypothetical protein